MDNKSAISFTLLLQRLQSLRERKFIHMQLVLFLCDLVMAAIILDNDQVTSEFKYNNIVLYPQTQVRNTHDTSTNGHRRRIQTMVYELELHYK